jgi:hypothetical protein
VPSPGEIIRGRPLAGSLPPPALHPPRSSSSLPPLTRADLATAHTRLLRDGRWANAQVFRVEAAGAAWIVKDFSRRRFWVRNTIGRVLLGRELRALRRLDGIDGVPQHPFRIDRHAIAAEFIPGVTLGQVPAEQLDTQFFTDLERLMNSVHARGVVHLDTRGTGNMLRRPDGKPALIDTRWMPASWRRWFNDLDMAGVYKKWLQRDPDAMGAARRELYERMTRWRRLWIARGYAGATKQKPSGPTGPT